MPGRSTNSEYFSGVHLKEKTCSPGSSAATANIFPPTLNTRSFTHCTFSVACGNERHCFRIHSMSMPSLCRGLRPIPRCEKFRKVELLKRSLADHLRSIVVWPKKLEVPADHCSEWPCAQGSFDQSQERFRHVRSWPGLGILQHRNKCVLHAHTQVVSTVLGYARFIRRRERLVENRCLEGSWFHQHRVDCKWREFRTIGVGNRLESVLARTIWAHIRQGRTSRD